MRFKRGISAGIDEMEHDTGGDAVRACAEDIHRQKARNAEKMTIHAFINTNISISKQFNSVDLPEAAVACSTKLPSPTSTAKRAGRVRTSMSRANERWID